MYALITKLRGLLFDKGIFKASEFDIPVINVGNLAVGGSGKTPHIEYIISILTNEFNLATLSRGYGRSTKGYREVLTDSNAMESGDEPLQIKLKFPKIGVFVGEDRVEAITKLLFDAPQTEAILLDDAFQHRAIKAGMNILLTDYSKIFTRDKSMPIGRLRECPSAAIRADIVVISKCPVNLSDDKRQELSKEIRGFTNADILFSSIMYNELYSFNKDVLLPTEIENILLISGLAKPQAMKNFIATKYKQSKIEHIKFRDHYRFNKKDVLSFIDKFSSFARSKRIIVVSEKDAIRLREVCKNTDFEKLPVFILPINIDFEKDKIKFDEKIKNYVRENKGNYSIPAE